MEVDLLNGSDYEGFLPPKSGRLASVKRGEVWFADFGTGIGSEQNGERPVLIIQNNVGNFFSPTVVVAALTDSEKRPMPTHLKIRAKDGVKKDSVAMMEQLRTIDKKRLSSRICVLSEFLMEQADEKIKISLGLVPVEMPRGVYQG
jgi:mRNA interferase MazF